MGERTRSGAGAAINGGRLNRPGTPALYLSLDTTTAIREYQQLSALMPPGTLVSYRITVARVVDFHAGYMPSAWSASWAEFDCDWRELWFNQRVEPPSWKLADEAIGAGAKGIVFASQQNAGGINLVLYTEKLEPPDELAVFYPAGDLPKNQDSWR